MNIVRSYASKVNAEGITAEQCNWSIFLFFTNFRRQKTTRKNVRALQHVVTNSDLVFMNVAAHFVGNS